jgi:antiviral helicase SKI2
MIHEEQQIQEQILDLKHKMSDQNLELLPDYQFRINVLEHYNFINAESIVQLKGRVACEVIFSLLISDKYCR